MPCQEFRNLFSQSDYSEMYRNDRNEYMKLYSRFKKHGTIGPPKKKSGGAFFDQLTEEQMKELRKDLLKYHRMLKIFKKTGTIDYDEIYRTKAIPTHYFKNSMSEEEFNKLRLDRKEYNKRYNMFKKSSK